MEKCENCDRAIGKLETPFVLMGRVVCAECNQRLRGQVVSDHAKSLPPASPVYYAPPAASSKRISAAILALLLGGLGVHKFYLGQPVLGLLYLLFFWTFIPAFIALIEAIQYLCMSDESFIRTYQR